MRTEVTIVGGGACALMLACELDPGKFKVSIYEKNTALGRKFLVAGDGGLNLTHSEEAQLFISRYTPQYFLEKAFSHFSNKDLRSWLGALGIETYVGSSGRVFPLEGIKPIAVLNRLLEQLHTNKVEIHTKHVLKEAAMDGRLIFEHKGELKEIQSEIVVFCMGGASWPVTGSSGDWAAMFRKKSIKVEPFQASNCSFQVKWDEMLLPKIEGKVLKNCAICCDAKKHFGEVVITRFGLEGSGIYPLSPQIRRQLQERGQAAISIDLKPAWTVEKTKEKITAKPPGKNLTEHLKAELNLGALQIQLLKSLLSKDVFMDAQQLAENIHGLRLLVTGTGPVEDAISTAGGVALDELDENYGLKKYPNMYVIGEMLSYDAPTGGYLLQSCFSMANYLAGHLNSNYQ